MQAPSSSCKGTPARARLSSATLQLCKRFFLKSQGNLNSYMQKCTISATTNKDHRCGFEKKMELPCLWTLWQAKISLWSPYICHLLIFNRVWKEYRRTNTTGQRSHLSCLSSSLTLTQLLFLSYCRSHFFATWPHSLGSNIVLLV